MALARKSRIELHCHNRQGIALKGVAEEVLARYNAERADSIETFGGGSTVALGKFVAAKLGALYRPRDGKVTAMTTQMGYPAIADQVSDSSQAPRPLVAALLAV